MSIDYECESESQYKLVEQANRSGGRVIRELQVFYLLDLFEHQSSNRHTNIFLQFFSPNINKHAWTFI